MAENLTKKQEALYTTIKEYIKENGYAPTIREINLLTNIRSTSTTHDKLKQLKKKGYISYLENKPRTIKILK